MKNTRSLSRFMRKTLLPDERVIRDARFPPIHAFWCCFALASFTLAGGAAQYAIYRYGGTHTWIPLALGAGVGVWQVFWMLLKRLTTEIVLTDQRLIYKTGFFMINVQEVDIEQLASDHVEQSLLGRFLDYGRLHIRCIEATDFRIPDISAPYEFRNGIEKQKRSYRDDYMKVERLRRQSGGSGN